MPVAQLGKCHLIRNLDRRLDKRLSRAGGTRDFSPQISKVEGTHHRRSLMANPKLEVLTPQNSQLIFIDQQPQMAFGVQSIDRQVLKNNCVALAKAAKVFNIPTI